jgi:hypothetical protein
LVAAQLKNRGQELERKLHPMKIRQSHWVRPGVALLLAACALTGLAAVGQAAEEFPHLIPFKLGRTEFVPGDSITIQTVRGTSDKLRTNETYCVEGTYTLSSRSEAVLALYVTTRQPVQSETDPRQILRVHRGTGSFRLLKTMDLEGCPHLTFYTVPSGSSFGGVYFGEGNWLWPQKGSSHPDRPSPRQDSRAGAGSAATPVSSSAGSFTERLSNIMGAGSAATPVSMSGPNRVLLEYLGNPVETPAALEAAYTPAGLREAVQSAASKAGISLLKLEIDDSEYPFLVGVVVREGDFVKLKTQLQKAGRYDYQGDVGSHTCLTFNITPWRTWPPDAQQRIFRRATVRMQAFYDRLRPRE